jgi:dihydroxyacetone kinase-like protein
MEKIMSDYTLKASTLSDILKLVCTDLKIHNNELQELDSQVGDGDLGVTVELACKSLEECLNCGEERDTGKLLAKCGLSINKASPSTFGTLLATAFIGAGKAVIGKEEVGPEDLAAMGEEAVKSIKNRGKSEVGNKTLLDSLAPAVETYKKELAGGRSVKDGLKLAAKAAHEGMKATIDMRAKYGRASWRPDGSVGLQDAGATAVYYIIVSFVDHLLEYLTVHKTINPHLH